MSLVYQVPQWDQRQWDRFVFADKSGDSERAIKAGTRKVYSYPRFATEVFHRLYSPGEEQELEAIKPENKWAEKLHEQLTHSSEFQELIDSVGGSQYLAGLGATVFIKELASKIPQPDKDLKDPQELREQVLALKRYLRQNPEISEQEQDELNQLIEKLVEQGKEAVAEMSNWEEKAITEGMAEAIVDMAAEKAEQVVSEQAELLSSLCPWGVHSDTDVIGGSLEDKLALAEFVRKNRKFQQIAKEAGRLKRLAVKKQQAKSKNANHTIAGVEAGRELNRVLPSELVALRESALRPMFVKKYSESSLLQYKLGGKNENVQGPIIILLDSTGSMGGSPEIWAKAFTLTLLGIASEQKRHCRVIHYGNGAVRVDDFPAGEKDTNKVMASMSYFRRDAINNECPAFDSAIECLMKEKNYKDADLVFITDGGCDFSYESRDRNASAKWFQKFEEQKQELGFSLYNVMINTSETRETKKLKADKTFILSDLQDDKAIEDMFAI